MREDQVAAVRDAAADGIDFDGFAVDRTGGEYRLAADGSTREDAAGAESGAHGDYATDSFEDVPDRFRDHVTNWYFWHAVAPQKPDRWAFLRWIERADELDVQGRYRAMRDGRLGRSWGQLRLTVTLGDDGDRRYAIRHEDDVGVRSTDLERYDDPGAARDVATHDADGRYRPLKTAPTLRTGWHFPDLDAGEFVAAVDFLYPATVANWHREREGDLDVSHWHETMKRQTGMYGLIETWDRGEGHEHVEWVAEACCTDSQCLKRREWEYDAETELAVDGGDGAFPCREPCSLVVAAARKWTKLEAEEPRSYEFELTPSEKTQIEAIIDAVADGDAGSIREADVSEGANRYRARFLRAKLFDEDGTLDGVVTGE